MLWVTVVWQNVAKKFRSGRTDVHDEGGQERRSIATDELVQKLEQRLRGERRFTTSELSEEFPQNFEDYRGSRGIAVPFHDHGTRRGWGVRVTPRPLFTPRKDLVPIVQEAGWALGPVWTGVENLSPNGIRSPDRPARSQSLYCLSYPALVCSRSQRLNTWTMAKSTH